MSSLLEQAVSNARADMDTSAALKIKPEKKSSASSTAAAGLAAVANQSMTAKDYHDQAAREGLVLQLGISGFKGVTRDASSRKNPFKASLNIDGLTGGGKDPGLKQVG